MSARSDRVRKRSIKHLGKDRTNEIEKERKKQRSMSSSERKSHRTNKIKEIKDNKIKEKTTNINLDGSRPKQTVSKRAKELRQSPNILKKAAGVLGDPKTTAVLGTTLAALTGVGAATGALGAGSAAAGAGGRAVITQTAFRGAATKTAQRALVGRPAISSVEKLFSLGRGIAARYATNTKSAGLTKSFLIKLGIGLGAVSLIKDAIGTYPFAGFLKEEAIQTTSFGFKQAEENGDIEGMIAATDQIREMLNAEKSIVDSIPYANVQKQVIAYMASARVTLGIQEQLIADRQAGEPSEFEENVEDARQLKLERRQQDAQYFALIREGKFEEAEELLQSQLEGGVQ